MLDTKVCFSMTLWSHQLSYYCFTYYSFYRSRKHRGTFWHSEFDYAGLFFPGSTTFPFAHFPWERSYPLVNATNLSRTVLYSSLTSHLIITINLKEWISIFFRVEEIRLRGYISCSRSHAEEMTSTSPYSQCTCTSANLKNS